MAGGVNGVVLTQCKNVLSGDRLKVDMTTGVSRVESDSKVKVLIEQSGQGCGSGSGGSKPAPAPVQIPSLIPGKK
jgi:lipopolysaccharide export system protein LptA